MSDNTITSEPIYEDNDEDSYDDYVITTINPSPYVLIGTFAFSLIMYMVLPFLVSWVNNKNRKKKRKREAKAAAAAADEATNSNRANTNDIMSGSQQQHQQQQQRRHRTMSVGSRASSSSCIVVGEFSLDDNGGGVTVLDNGDFTPSASLPPPAAGRRYNFLRREISSSRSLSQLSADGNASVVSRQSSTSSIASFIDDFLTPAVAEARKNRYGGRRKRAIMNKRNDSLDNIDGGTSQLVDDSILLNDTFLSAQQEEHHDHSIEDLNNDSSFVSAKQHLSMDILDLSHNSSSSNHVDNTSFVAGQLHDLDEFDDTNHGGIDGGDGLIVVAENKEKGRQAPAPNDKKRNWRQRRRSAILSSYDKLLSIAEWDYETKRIYKLGFPFFLQAVFEGGLEIGRLAIIGRLLGTNELAAYVIVDMLIGFTGEIVGGISESLCVLLSHSIGSGNRILTGQYLQLSVILTIVFTIPFMVMWYFAMSPAMRILGFEENIVDLGMRLTIPLLFESLLEGIADCIHGLLDVTDLEMVSTILVIIFETISTIAVFVAAWFWPEPPLPLEMVGYIYLVESVIYLCVTLTLIGIKGWFQRYYKGFFWTCALSNRPAVKMMLKTASILSAGYLLAYAEWEILAFFASFLGPAEVAAWAILGTLWDVMEEITESIADSSEVRVALHLGGGRPGMAKKSAYKSVFIAFIFALVSTSVLFIAGDSISSLLTTDTTLQMLINQLIPLFGLGNIMLTMGTMAWTIVGAQGRYSLSTAISCAGTWLITIPLGAVFSIVFRINLQGQTAAIVVGYMLSGMVTNLVLLTSDWSSLSEKVIKFNKDNDHHGGDDDDSSSSSSDDDRSSASKTSSGIETPPPKTPRVEKEQGMTTTPPESTTPPSPTQQHFL